eukprot:g80997.t1
MTLYHSLDIGQVRTLGRASCVSRKVKGGLFSFGSLLRFLKYACHCGILVGVAIKADGAEIDAVLKELEGKDLDKLMEQGMEKLGTASAGFGGGGGGGGGGGAAAEKEKEKEKEESSEEESEADMGFSLFD